MNILKRLWPDSIAGRAFLVVVLGLLLSHAVALGLYVGNRHAALAQAGGRLLSDRLASIVQTMEETPAPTRPRLARILSSPVLRISWSPQPLAEDAGPGEDLAEALRTLLSDRLGREIELHIWVGPFDPQADGWPGPGRHHHIHPPFHQMARISVRLGDGSWVNAVAPTEIGDTLWRPRFALPLTVTGLTALGLTWWAVKRTTFSLATFAAAAERLGHDVTAAPLDEQGPREVRKAAHALNEMQRRLRRLIDNRTLMVASISHDLRTPITRMHLRAEFIEDDEVREKMLADLGEMETMIAATLSFARHESTHEPRRALDLATLLREVAEDHGTHAVVRGAETLPFQGRPTALKRAFANLVGNAVKYGGSAEITLADHGGSVAVTVADHGSGIPVEERERVFAPFYRIESSRSRATGGTGLGLAVARGVVEGHGGEIALGDNPGGGLMVTVVLPRQGRMSGAIR